MEEPGVLHSLAGLGLARGHLLQLCLAAFLLRRGGDSTNCQGRTALELVRPPEARMVLERWLERGEGCSPTLPPPSEHDYAEILEQESEVGEAAEALEELAVEDKTEEKGEEEECMVCSEQLPLVTFLPCNHRILCTDCSARVKK